MEFVDINAPLMVGDGRRRISMQRFVACCMPEKNNSASRDQYIAIPVRDPVTGFYLMHYLVVNDGD